jgi:hypothetical protein
MLLVITKMQIKAILQCYYIAIKMTKTEKKMTVPNSGEGEEKVSLQTLLVGM